MKTLCENRSVSTTDFFACHAHHDLTSRYKRNGYRCQKSDRSIFSNFSIFLSIRALTIVEESTRRSEEDLKKIEGVSKKYQCFSQIDRRRRVFAFVLDARPFDESLRRDDSVCAFFSFALASVSFSLARSHGVSLSLARESFQREHAAVREKKTEDTRIISG